MGRRSRYPGGLGVVAAALGHSQRRSRGGSSQGQSGMTTRLRETLGRVRKPFLPRGLQKACRPGRVLMLSFLSRAFRTDEVQKAEAIARADASH